MHIAHASLDFTNDNIILITGENGEGKSSLLEAIAICMCEHKRGSSFKDYVKVGNDNAHIELSATIKGQGDIVFDVFLNERGGTPYERVITWNGKEFRNSECNEVLQSLNLIFYSDIIFAMQQESDIVKLTPAQRSKFMQQIFNFDFESKVRDIQSQLETNTCIMNMLKGKIDALSVAAEKPQHFCKIPDLTESDIEERRRVLADLQKELAEITDYNNKLKEQANEKLELEKKLASLHGKYDLHIAQRATYDNIIDTKKPQKTLEEWDAEINAQKEEWSKQEDLLSGEEDTQYKLQEELNETNKQMYAFDFSIKSVQDKMKQVENGVCPICGKEFTEHDKQDFSKELDDLFSKKQKAQETVNESKKKLEQCKESQEDIKHVIVNLQYKVHRLEEKRIADAHVIADVNLAVLERAKNEDAIKQCESDIETLSTILSNKVDVEYKDASVLASKITEIQKEISDYESIIQFNNAQNEILYQWEENEKKRVADLAVEKTKFDELKKKNATLEEVVDLLHNKLPSYIIVKKCSEISNEMNSLIHACFPNIEIGLSQTKRGVEFIYKPDNQKKIEKSSSMASGFQKELISLAFRLALCKIYNLSFSFFDEIDSQSSEKNSEIVYKYILDLNLFNQIFIISQRRSTIDYIYSNYDVSVYKAANNTYTKMR